MANTVYFPAGSAPVADPTKTNSGGYAFQNWAIDDALLARFAKEGVMMFATTGSIGSQQMAAVNEFVKKINEAAQQKLKNTAAELKAINPAFDPSKFLIDPTTQMSAGEGAAANRSFFTEKSQLQMAALEAAVKAAQTAATEYEKTGKIAPYPSTAEMLKSAFTTAYGRDPYGDSYYQQLASRIDKPLTAEDKATANAAAARVGAPLPYPDGGIGQIAGGGVFQNAEQAQQAYTNGQLNTVGQNIVNSNSAGNMQDGVNQATVNPDGTVSWNGKTYPNKDAAALAANSVGVTSLRFGDGSTVGGAAGLTGGTAGPTTGTAGTTGGVGTSGGATLASVQNVDPQAQAQAMGILNQYLNDGTIDNGTYQMFKKAVELWNPGTEVDYANILNTFETIKQTDINPYFKEQAALFTSELEANRDYIIQSKVLEEQSFAQDKKKLKEDMQKDLAARGMLFTGESVKQLGAEGTFATEGTPEAQKAAIPTVQPFADGVFQQQTQAASSASNLRYQKSLQDLQRQAESRLGTTNAGLIPGTTAIGGITGSLEREKKQAYGSALTGLYNQEMTNVEARSGQESQIFKE